MQMQPESISVFLFWLPSWAQAHHISKIPRQSEMQNVVAKTWSGGKTIRLSAEEGRSMTFRDRGGESHSNSVLGKAIEIEKTGGRRLGTDSEWNAQSLKCRWTRDSMWREWKQMQPVACAKFWDLAWCGSRDWNYFLLEDKIMYTAMKRRSNGEQSGLVGGRQVNAIYKKECRMNSLSRWIWEHIQSSRFWGGEGGENGRRLQGKQESGTQKERRGRKDARNHLAAMRELDNPQQL